MKDIKEAINHFLPYIDRELAVWDVLLKVRPLRAAIKFLNDYVIEVAGENKTDFATKPWFAEIYHHVEEWYHDHYGAAFKRDGDGTRIASGIVLIRDIPVELRVPLTRSQVETPGETAWLIFPVDVEKDEEPLTWLVNPPNLDRMPINEKTKLVKQITKIATALRIIRMNLMGIEPSDTTIHGLLDGVIAEFEGCANYIIRDDASGRGAALWALQMCVERTLKAFSQHKCGSFREIHNLFELFDDVASHLVGVDRNLLKKIPRDKQVINDRYGLGGTPTRWEVIEAYNSALTIVSGVSRSFRRKIYFGGGRILLKRPPWLSLPLQEVPMEGSSLKEPVKG